MGRYIKIKNWDDQDVLFIEKNGQWWAFLRDICKMLGLKPFEVSCKIQKLEDSNEYLSTFMGRINESLSMGIAGEGEQHIYRLISESGVYQVISIFCGCEATKAQSWVKDTFSELSEVIIERGD